MSPKKTPPITLEPSKPPRNRVAAEAFKRRAGAHGKNAGGIRQSQQLELRQQLRSDAKDDEP